MAYEQKNNTGSLFKNDKRATENHPNAKGTALIDGVEYWISAWSKVSTGGVKWQSLSFERKERRAPRVSVHSGAPYSAAEQPDADFDDFGDVPF